MSQMEKSDGTSNMLNDSLNNGNGKYEKIRLTGSQKAKKIFHENSLMITTMIGVVLGFALGFGIRCIEDKETKDIVVRWIDVPGTVFIRLLKMTIVPLIAANVICVTASLDPKVNGKISIVAFAYILCANVFSAILGVTCSLIIEPGKRAKVIMSSSADKAVSRLTTSDVFSDLIMNIFPDNIIAACMFKTQTSYEMKFESVIRQLEAIHRNTSLPLNDVNDTGAVTVFKSDFQRIETNSASVNMIGILFIAFIFGMASRMAKDAGKPFLALFKSISVIVSLIMTWFLWMTPPGVCFMIAASVAGVDDIVSTISNLAFFILTLIVALVIQFFLFNILLFSVSRKNPFSLIPPAAKAWFISFATTSPVVAIPDMYVCCDKYKISPNVSRFVIPFAAALKGDGPACFVGAAAIFIAQISGTPLNSGNVVVITLLTTCAMLAIPNIPSASMVILMTVLSSVGIPINTVSLLFAVEWLTDRLRSGNMGLGHCYCAAFTHFACLKDIRRQELAAINNANGQDDICHPSDEEALEMKLRAQKELNV